MPCRDGLTANQIFKQHDGNFQIKIQVQSTKGQREEHSDRTFNYFKALLNDLVQMGRGGSLMISILAFYSDDPSSNPAEAYCVYSERPKLTKKEGGDGR